ncbi:MAG: ABC-F family ATP-binding cassette domain-containing protein [Ardenticatenaceae bacterium]|nr:ABC-F family ATP-binding cassette domain-containing protein [Ardenticatenaceae bacterium]MCB8989534.1 ABC-F family ATP-binding cassette domain-containing protein [Ardenticatenaceae bacterium]MCB9003077.1 ABC-F family ATP-binding cassette domain-containing protein [Ardenticatenaceae bacterium]
MSILTATDLSQAFGAEDLFSDVSVAINPKERIGLVGPNGVGKTTLLLILAGLQEPETGSIVRSRDLALGYLRQEAALTFSGLDHSIFAEMLTVFADLQQMAARLRELEALMAAGESREDVLDEYGRIQHTYEHSGGYDYQVDIKRVLQGLGFPQEQWDTPLNHLSGGQKTRVLLGRLLLEKPDLLILDEPTNHLDIDAVEWLERTLHNWPGALLIVSHDRYFLDRVVNQMWEMRRSGVESYKGNYTAYLQQRQERWEREQAVFLAEKERLEQELDWARRHIAGGKTDIAKGKMKRLTRDIVLIEQVGVLGKENKSWLEIGGRVRTFTINEADARLRALRPPDDRPPRLNIKLQSDERSGRVALRAKKLQIGYPGAPLFTCDKIKLEREDCAALIGPNGSGKTTLLRTLLGEIPPLRGDIFWGDNVQIGYFAQAHEQLNAARRVLDELRAHVEMEEPEARRYLAQYLFRGDDVFKRVRELSGGERGRLALAILARQGANVLLLDEPTNHLDIPAQEVVQAVLELFDGTVLLVSHDRYLVNRLATQIWEVQPGDGGKDGRLHIFEGNYAAFLGLRDGEPPEEAGDAAQAKVLLPQTAAAAPPPDVSWVENIAPPPASARPKRKKKPKAQSWEARVGELDEELAEAEAWLAELEMQLETAVATADDPLITKLQAEHAEAEAQVAELLAEWEELMG